MIRRVGETVAVRTTQSDSTEDPTTFLWRGRIYVVREVLGHWRERRAWWTGAAARAVHGEGDSQDAAASYSRAGTTTVPTAPGTRVALNHEREVWRVEASAGRTFGTGIYDLCRDAGAEPAVTPDTWQLLRVTD